MVQIQKENNQTYTYKRHAVNCLTINYQAVYFLLNFYTIFLDN